LGSRAPVDNSLQKEIISKKHIFAKFAEEEKEREKIIQNKSLLVSSSPAKYSICDT
jgi:hypothetical protein